MRRRAALAVLLSAVTAGLVGCTATAGTSEPTRSAAGTVSGRSAAVLAGGAVEHAAAALPQRSIGAAPPDRLAKGLTPPTNRWYSGLVFGKDPQPVFPYPLSFALTPSGFTTGLPVPTATANTIASANRATVTADVGATGAEVSAYDEVSVTLRYTRGGSTLGHVTLAEGAALVAYRAARAQTVRLSAPVQATAADRGVLTVGGERWGVRVDAGRLDGSTVRLRGDGALVLVPLPDGTTAAQTRTVLAHAAPFTGVETSYATDAGTARTQLRYRTAGDAGTLLVPAVHQGRSAAGDCVGPTYSTAYGRVPLCTGTRIAFSTPTVQPAASLDLSRLDDGQRSELRGRLRTDVRDSPAFATDTYFGGKSLYRSAMLLDIAEQLGDKASARTLRARLVAALDRWTSPGGCTDRGEQCFVYDPALKTVVGLKNAFGSEQDNDHHFHYGYFLTAAALVARYDPSAVHRWAPVMDLLAADLAARSGTDDGPFPTARLYDPYFSHSWASGFSPFADGNNQESSSEAVNAWNGLALWAQATKDPALETEARWMLSGETASALAYWVAPDLHDPAFAGFDHDMVSLNWGAKRDFATWFSPDPNAVVAIQLVPMGPVSGYLGTPAAGGSAQIHRLLAAAAPHGYAVTYGDYLLMYRSLAGVQDARAALRAARTLPAKAIDDGDSRTYLLAYLMARSAG